MLAIELQTYLSSRNEVDAVVHFLLRARVQFVDEELLQALLVLYLHLKTTNYMAKFRVQMQTG